MTTLEWEVKRDEVSAKMREWIIELGKYQNELCGIPRDSLERKSVEELTGIITTLTLVVVSLHTTWEMI